MKMSYRKLTPMAAKAAGINIEYEEDGSIAAYWNELDDCWEPLHDRDDAHRLSVKLGEDYSVGYFESESARIAVVERAAAIGSYTP